MNEVPEVKKIVGPELESLRKQYRTSLIRAKASGDPTAIDAATKSLDLINAAVEVYK